MGRAWKFGDNVDTDVITPTEYIINSDPEEYLPHVLEIVRPEFPEVVEPGDVVVAGKNFGSGSSRETAADAFVHLDVDAVIAESFARIFFRNAINVGLPIYESPEAARAIEDGHEVEIRDGAIVDETTGTTHEVGEYPEFVQTIFDEGGLIEYHRNVASHADDVE